MINNTLEKFLSYQFYITHINKMFIFDNIYSISDLTFKLTPQKIIFFNLTHLFVVKLKLK